jgi:hypothetical protein
MNWSGKRGDDFSHQQLDRVFGEICKPRPKHFGESEEALVRARTHPAKPRSGCRLQPKPNFSHPQPTTSSLCRLPYSFVFVDRLRSIVFRCFRFVSDAVVVVAASVAVSKYNNLLSVRLPLFTRQHAISSVTLRVYGTIDEPLGSCQAPNIYHRKFSPSHHAPSVSDNSRQQPLVLWSICDLQHHGHSKA